MSDIIGLNDRLIEKARHELKRDIHSTTDRLRDKMALGYSWDAGLYDAEGKHVQPWKVVEMVEKSLYDQLVKTAEQEAIDEFMKKVESLQDQINEIAASAGQ